MASLAYESVSLRRGPVTEIRFHSDGGSMCWSPLPHREAGDVFAEVAGDPETKVVIVTGTADAFCAEVDAESFAGIPWDRIWWEGKRLINNLLSIDVPVIGALNGPAFVHAEIPLLADVVIAAETAAIADKAHMLLGTPPGDGVHLIWPYLLGPRRAKYFLLFGQELSANEALELGVVNEVLPAAEVHSRAWQLAEQLAEKPLPFLRYLREILNMQERPRLTDGLSHGLGLEGMALLSAMPGEPD